MLGIGNPNLPFPDLGSQLQIVIDFCAVCSQPGVFVGQAEVTGDVTTAPEPSTSSCLGQYFLRCSSFLGGQGAASVALRKFSRQNAKY